MLAVYGAVLLMATVSTHAPMVWDESVTRYRAMLIENNHVKAAMANVSGNLNTRNMFGPS